MFWNKKKEIPVPKYKVDDKVYVEVKDEYLYGAIETEPQYSPYTNLIYYLVRVQKTDQIVERSEWSIKPRTKE